MSERGAERIRALLAGALDWGYLQTLALEHGVIPLLNLHLQAVAKGRVPSEQLQWFGGLSESHARATLTFASELFRVLEILRAANLPVVSYKGPVIAAQAYGDPALRAYSDLDLILPHRDLPRAWALLAAQGYQSEISPAAVEAGKIPGQYPFSRRNSQVPIELHTEQTLRYFPRPLNLEAMLQRLKDVSLCGQTVQVFAPEDTLSLLCVHGSKHFWERLMWIADIAALVERSAALDWARAFEEAHLLGAERMVHLGLLLAESLLEARLPEEVSKEVSADRGAVTLANHVRASYFGEERSTPRILERMMFRVRMRGAVIAGAGYLLRLVTTPTEEDWAGTAKGRTSVLASVLRPLRLVRKYGLVRDRAEGPAASGREKRPGISPGP